MFRNPVKARIQRKVLERTLQAQAEKLAGALGWLPYHMPPNVVICERCGYRNFRHVMKGFPDLCLVPTLRLPAGTRLLFLELKTRRGWVDPDQTDTHELLRRAGERVEVIRENDADRLHELLTNPPTS